MEQVVLVTSRATGAAAPGLLVLPMLVLLMPLMDATAAATATDMAMAATAATGTGASDLGGDRGCNCSSTRKARSAVMPLKDQGQCARQVQAQELQKLQKLQKVQELPGSRGIEQDRIEPELIEIGRCAIQISATC